MITYDKLQSNISKTEWKPLEEHYLRDALFIISKELKLVDVAYAIATDQQELLKKWLSLNQFRRPSDKEISEFKSHKEKFISFIILQPYVIISIYE